MSNVLKMLSRGGAAETDPNFKQTVLLLHGDGTNGAQNNTFLDSSSNNFTITRNGNTTQGTFTPFSLAAGEWSNYFDGSGDYLSLANNSAFDITSGNFCAEMWLYKTVSGVSEEMLWSQRTATPVTGGWECRLTSANLVQFFFVGGSVITSASAIPLNTWTHLAVTRASNTVRIFINGVVDATATFANGTTVTQSLFVGYGTTGGSYFTGYISNARLVKGSSVYTSSFTPPTTPLTNITNTSLLTCQSNRFVDNSTNNFAITRNGDVRVTPFSPFAPTAAYSAGTNGGSGYFDGTGDSLSIANAAALDLDANFTIEAWIYPTSLPNTFQTIVITSDNTTGAGGIGIWARSTGEIQVYSIPASSAIIDTSGFGLTVNQWTHIAVTRSGSTVTLYKNGASFTTGTSSSNFNSSTPTVIGNSTTANQGFFGYISGLRILKGTAQAPDITQPPTNITNTSLLCNFTNAGILDNTGKNNLETVGNAQIDTTTKKFGTGSLEFDGTGDYLVCNSGGQDLAFGSGAFTVEFWVYINTVKNNGLIDFRPNGTTSGAYVTLYQESGGTIRFYVNGSDRITGASLSASTWYHIALTRSGTDTKLFVNGSQSGSTYTDSTVYLNPSNRPVIGHISDNVADTVFPLNGYIDDLRITKGVARYTANFTAPTKEFPDL